MAITISQRNLTEDTTAENAENITQVQLSDDDEEADLV